MMLKQRAVGAFVGYEAAEIALQELEKNGFSMYQVSLIGHDINRHAESTGANTSSVLINNKNLDTDENEAESAAQKGAIAGSAFGGVTGLLIGLGAIAIPGIGPVMLAGAAATAIATAISGTAIGAVAGSLAGGLTGLGIPADRAQIYSDRVAQGNYLVMVEAEPTEIAAAQSVFSRHGIQDWHIYELTDQATRRTVVANHPEI